MGDYLSGRSINLGLFERDERQAVFETSSRLAELEGWVERAYNAFLLVDHAGNALNTARANRTHPALAGEEENKNYLANFRLYSDWKMIAFSDIGMSINHFRKCMIDIRNRSKKIKSLSLLVDDKKLGEAERLWVSNFANAEKVRHTIAHAAEFGSDKWFTQHKTKGPISNEFVDVQSEGVDIIMTNNVFGNKFVTTYEGKIIEYEMNEKTLENLKEVLLKFYSAFDAACRR